MGRDEARLVAQEEEAEKTEEGGVCRVRDGGAAPMPAPRRAAAGERDGLPAAESSCRECWLWPTGAAEQPKLYAEVGGKNPALRRSGRQTRPMQKWGATSQFYTEVAAAAAGRRRQWRWAARTSSVRRGETADVGDGKAPTAAVPPVGRTPALRCCAREGQRETRTDAIVQ